MKTITITLLVLSLILVMSIPVYATSSSVENFGEFILDGERGFFQSIVDSIGGAVGAVGRFITDIGKTIAKAVNWILDGIYNLFVPREGYFDNFLQRIQRRFHSKFGNILSLSEYLRSRFAGLRSNRNNSSLLSIRFPNNDYFYGSFNLLGAITNYIPMIRGAFTGMITLMTVSYCYKRVKEVINT